MQLRTDIDEHPFPIQTMAIKHREGVVRHPCYRFAYADHTRLILYGGALVLFVEYREIWRFRSLG